MRRTRAALALLAPLMAAGIAVVGAGPALAGGPTSVLLVAPGGGGTASLYYDDAEYAELGRLLGAEGSPGGTTDGSGDEHASGSQVNVTWLIHDVTVWRVDRIYLGGPGGPWVGTQEGFGQDVTSMPVAWHRPAEPTALVALLTRLGIDAAGGGSAVLPATRPTEVAPSAAAPSADAAASVVRREPADRSSAPWLLVGVAFLGGAALSAAATRRLVRPRPAAPQPPSSGALEEATAQGGEWSPADELASSR